MTFSLTLTMVSICRNDAHELHISIEARVRAAINGSMMASQSRLFIEKSMMPMSENPKLRHHADLSQHHDATPNPAIIKVIAPRKKAPTGAGLPKIQVREGEQSAPIRRAS
ncbi:hypothetical protein ACWKW9_23480 [Rhizobium daejeonense]